MDETIVAPGTAPLPAARAVVRISGAETWQVLAPLVDGALPQRAGLHPLRLRLLPDAPPLPAQALCFRAPRSSTGEDLIELHLPGGALVEELVGRLLASGGVLPGPGEFTRRAFLAGKLDLAGAEAVGALIAARAEGELRQAWDLAHSGLAAEIESVRAPLFRLLSHLEAELDFGHHEIDLLDEDEARRVLSAARTRLAELSRQERASQPLARVCLEGPPNAGKSSLFNALLGSERALTSDRAGTTRDVVEEVLQLPSMRVLLQDLAGREEAHVALERAAQERSRRSVDAADLVLSVRPADRGEPFLPGALAVTTKLDLDAAAPHPGSLGVSAHRGEGLAELARAIEARVASASEGGRVLRRHREQLLRADEALAAGIEALDAGLGSACLALDLRTAVQGLGALSGQDFAEDLLDRIFAGFCIGK